MVYITLQKAISIPSKLKIVAILIIELLILTILFSGSLIFQSNNAYNITEGFQKEFTNKLIDVETSNNYVYAATTENYTHGIIINKYDTGLNLVSSFSFNFSNELGILTHSIDIVAATDQNVMLDEFISTVNSSQTNLLIVDKYGIESSFNMSKETNNGGFLQPLAMGFNYFVAYTKQLSDSTFIISGHKLSNNNSSSPLFQTHINANTIESPFYRNSNTIEIPFYSIESKLYKSKDNIEVHYPHINYFTKLQYDIRKNSTDEILSSINLKYNQNMDQYVKEPSVQNYVLTLLFIPFDSDYLLLQVKSFNYSQTEFQIGTESTYTANILIHSKFSLSSPLLPIYRYFSTIMPSFQIANKLYLNIQLSNITSYNTGLLTYTHYSFHSTLDFENYTYVVADSYMIEYAYAAKLGENLLYFGQVVSKGGNGTTYYFLKTFKILKTDNLILNLLYQFPLFIKILIGGIIIIPTAFYLIKGSKLNITNSELYPGEK